MRIPVRATPRIRYIGGAYEAIGEEWTHEGLGAEKPGDKLSQRKGGSVSTSTQHFEVGSEVGSFGVAVQVAVAAAFLSLLQFT